MNTLGKIKPSLVDPHLLQELRQIKELEMEFDIGNINQKDLETSRKELKVEVSEVITKINANKI